MRSTALTMQRDEPRFKQGDWVRVKYYLSPLEHRFLPNYKDFVYTVSRVVLDYPRYRYKLKKENGDEEQGTFYEEELQHINEPEYRVEKIVKERVRRDGVPEVVVKWVGYPASYNSWIPRSNLRQL